ncbi:hypothetical protein EXE25_19035 [Acinetobacter bouvetii]|uniref:Uncharacterized protein n=1 Tax=Acinetobacter bouvetii TaxID=202951 RepID=A0A4Q7AKX9_9GAMM|nr:hypothetical protein [Acinetobacter bouvetii]RZG63609.1 hypothetical protein EXE25_19035 [Acinetobacter bouvetii]
MSDKHELPELHTYRNLSSGEKLAINQMLISYVWEVGCLFNIHMKNDAKSYNLVKLTSINFENEATSIWVHFETITGESIGIPLDFLSKIERSGQEDI